MNYLDLFSGIGGFHKGLVEAGFDFNWCGHSEIDKYAKSIYEKHFPESEDLGDVSGINVSELPRIDIITFGFPCQDLSVAGRRQGLSGRRSSLFYEAMRIIKVAKPKIFIFENVLGLYSSGDPRGGDFTAVLREIASLGLYDCEWQTLNTRWFLPQNRERIYFIGHLRGRSKSKVFPFSESNEIFKQGRRQRPTKDKLATAITQNLKRGVHSGGETLIQVGNIDTTGQDRHGIEIHNLQRRNSNRPSLTRVCDCDSGKLYKKCCGVAGGSGHLSKKDGTTYALDSQCGQGVKIESSIRRLTPVECARLQGFPDDWCEGISDTQQYKCYGNAVSVPVVAAIGRELL